MFFFSSLQVVGGLLLLIIGGELLLRGAVGIAKHFGVSPLLIGLTVVSCATSMPELVVTVAAGLANRPDLGVGNVVGSNIANILLILGVTAMVSRIKPPDGMATRDGGAMLLASFAFVVMAFMGPLTWPNGAILLTLLGAYLVYSYRSEIKRGDVALDPEAQEALEAAPKSIKTAAVLVALGAISLIVGSELLVDGAVTIARGLGVSDAAIGLTLVAFGTSLPELATSVVAALRKHADVAIGNVVGSNIFNVLGILGVLPLVVVTPVGAEILRFDIWVMLAASLVLVLILSTGVRIGRIMGCAFLLLYLGFVAEQFVPIEALLSSAR